MDRESFHTASDPSTLTSLSPQIIQIIKRVRDRFAETYGGHLCAQIQTTLFGRAFDATFSEELEARRKEDIEGSCPGVTENAAGWTVEAILEAEAASV
jgi:hypothetical protein